MKNSIMKKFTNIALAGSMLFGSVQVAFAADEPTANITINEAKGNEYKAFKLMDLKTDDVHYSYKVNEKYRSVITASIGEMDATADTSTDEAIINYLEGLKDNPTATRTFADKVYNKIKAGNMEAEMTTTDGNFKNSAQGYYIIAETGTIAAGTDRTLVMLDTLGKADVTVTEKRGVPTIDKVIVENNTDVEHIDAGLGDDVTYKITGTMPENIASYPKYKFVVHDNLPAGLTYKEVSSITIGGTAVATPTDFEVKNPTDTDCTVEFKFDDLKATASAMGVTLTADTEVVIQYKATVNAEATVGNPGNQNTAKLEFSNDPYDEGSTETTPGDDAKVFTFAVAINKVDKDKSPLAGAEFKLQKKGADGNYTDMVVDTNVEYKKNAEGTVFTFEGLDVGEYKLIESVVPTGYNKADDVLFSIEASYENEAVSKLTVKDSEGNVIGETDSTATDAIFSIDSQNGTMSTDVVNTTGIKLPSTGSTGAIIVYTVSGIAMTLCIASFVVAKKKKNNKTE